MWIDAHCHLADLRFAPDLSDLLRNAEAAGIGAWIQGGIDPEDWTAQEALQKAHPNRLHLAFGLHPWHFTLGTEVDLDGHLNALEARLPGAGFLGETGLDRVPKYLDSYDFQVRSFEAHLSLAKRFQKPLVLHIVQAHEQALELLEAVGPFPQSGLVHAFSGSLEQAQRYEALGFLISVGGAITRPGYKNLKHAVEEIGPDHLVVETDCPDQAPGMEKGVRNEPIQLLTIAKALAPYRGETFEAVLDRSASNLNRLIALAHVTR